MKQNYETVTAEIICLQAEDAITSSYTLPAIPF